MAVNSTPTPSSAEKKINGRRNTVSARQVTPEEREKGVVALHQPDELKPAPKPTAAERLADNETKGVATGNGNKPEKAKAAVKKAAKKAPPAKDERDLKQVAEQVAQATRLDGAEVKLTPNGREARIVVDGRTISYVSLRNGAAIRVHVTHWSKPEDRQTVKADTPAKTVAAAAKLVKTSEKRSPKEAKK